MDTFFAWLIGAVSQCLFVYTEEPHQLETGAQVVEQEIVQENVIKYVLVVEDNTMISMILEQTLQTMGYTAIVAENGRIAIEKFQSFL